MTRQNRAANGLYDPRNGDPAIRAATLDLTQEPHEPARSNYFTIYWIESGSGQFWADAASFRFHPDSLLFFTPYQHIRFAAEGPGRVDFIQFHANFLCVETFHSEVGCSGTLFNDPYGVPVVELDASTKCEVVPLFHRIRFEQSKQELAYREVMLASLKILLVLAARMKSSVDTCLPAPNLRRPLLTDLRELIEAHYTTWHAPADYARQLHVTAKTLGRIVRDELGTTLTELIKNRILIHAKWQLLHTLKPVKEVARELGFTDELYFSRLFKKATGYSPLFFREFETEIRGGSNLSMTSSHAPILRSEAASDN